jgi:hypothetical protein
MPGDPQGQRIAAHLKSASQDLPHEITERLRAARVRAVAVRKVSAEPLHTSGGEAVLGFSDEGITWRDRLAAFVPLLALVAGLVLINAIHDDHRAKEIAEVDAALLIDDLPPDAYADPGFARFLKTSSIAAQ